MNHPRTRCLLGLPLRATWTHIWWSARGLPSSDWTVCELGIVGAAESCRWVFSLPASTRLLAIARKENRGQVLAPLMSCVVGDPPGFWRENAQPSVPGAVAQLGQRRDRCAIDGRVPSGKLIWIGSVIRVTRVSEDMGVICQGCPARRSDPARDRHHQPHTTIRVAGNRGMGRYCAAFGGRRGASRILANTGE